MYINVVKYHGTEDVKKMVVIDYELAYYLIYEALATGDKLMRVSYRKGYIKKKSSN